jgi:hypothetical protein
MKRQDALIQVRQQHADANSDDQDASIHVQCCQDGLQTLVIARHQCSGHGTAVRPVCITKKAGRFPERPLSSRYSFGFALAANVCFSNWVFRSSSFSLFVLGLCLSSGSRFSSQSGLMFEWHRCKHMSDRQWRAPLSGALQDAQQTFSASSTNLVR